MMKEHDGSETRAWDANRREGCHLRFFKKALDSDSGSQQASYDAGEWAEDLDA